ncbi:transcriptional regulator [Deinococcus piscis]|uniref:Transcriptional regulator n=1 Tax=Deinococcus piscis TaxID=394230 RepID=A0ABQ3JY73_9DEIO|nr:helix-turn-helix domain-containing protein [Deinococcus piscis]GHF95371.1 transcriptional regulator [Deinococcus piscis]
MTEQVPARLAELERRLAALEAQVAALSQPDRSPGPATDRAWALESLQELVPDGAVLFAGHVQLGAGGDWVWQEAHPAAALLDRDWSGVAAALSALGHPLRLALLRAALDGPQPAPVLGERVGLSGGQLYHHLRELQAAGWLQAQARGPYRVPGGRVIPLLTVLAACGLREAGPAHAEAAPEVSLDR